MATNEAPEKIYITLNIDRKWQTEAIDDESIEYTRTDQIRKIVEIAREEVIDKVCDYIKNNINKHLYVYAGHPGFPTHQFINDLKQAMNDE